MRCLTRWSSLVPTAVWLCATVASGAETGPLAVDEHTVLLLHLDEGKGNTAADASPNHFGGGLHGAQWNVGRFGYCLAFDGTGTYYDVSHGPGLCPTKGVTVEAWVKLQQPSGDAICKNGSYFMRIGGGLKAYFSVDGKWRILDGNKALPRRRWTHVAMTYDSASRTMRTFIDGVLDAEKKLEGLKSYELSQSSEQLRIGGNTWRATGGVVGKVDEVRISDVARSFEPIGISEAKRVETYVPNGSFEFGRHGWRGNREANSRLQWRVDPDTASHGRCSMRSITQNSLTVISKPIPFPAGGDYVLSADMKSDAAGGKVTLMIATTHLPKRTSTQRRRKYSGLATEWKTVRLPVTDTGSWQTGYVYVSISKSGGGTFWIDNVRLLPADAPAGTDVVQDAFGVRFETERLGDTYFADTGPQTADVQVVNASAQRRRIRVTSQIADFFGGHFGKVDHGVFALGPYEAKALPFTVDIGRRGPFRVDFEATDLAGRQSRVMSYRYNVITPMKGVGDAAGSPFGMNTHMEREPNEHLSCNLEMLSQCGVKWIRAWWGWGMVEKEPGRFDWTEYDRQYDLVTEKKMQIMPILLRYYSQFEHAWAGSMKEKIQNPPGNLEQWGSYVFETVSRFRGRVRIWEIWNEPLYTMEADLYTKICKVTYAQARRADRNCKLVGFAGVSLEFMTESAEAGAFDAMDILSEHSYSSLTRPETAMPERHQKVRDLLGKHNKSMPIWHSEQGTGADGDRYVAGLLTEKDCASSLARGYLCALASGVEKFFWFSSQTSPTYGWAVFYEDYVPRPRLLALNGLASQLEGATFRERVNMGDNAVGCVFQKGRDAVVATWNLVWPVTLTIPSSPADARVVDMMGNVRTRIRRGAKIDVSLHHTLPVYLVLTNTTAEKAADLLRRAALNEEQLWAIEITKKGRGVVEVGITNKFPHALDAVVTLSCEPQVRFKEERRFVLDVQADETRMVTFTYEARARSRRRTVTATVEAGPLLLRPAKARKGLRL